LVQNGHISLSSFVEKINNNNNLIDTSSSAVSNIEKKPIRLNSPIGGSAISWHWSEKEKNNIGIEVVDIIRLALVHFPDLATPLKSKLESVDVFNYDQVRSLAKKFNKISKETALTRKENSSKSSQNASKELLHQIITRCYNKAVDNEKALNKHYEAFSSQTYGETSYERMQMIIEELKPSQKDVFVDLGSGVGQLVVHVAGGTLAHRAVGIEIASLPSKFAKKLEHEFKKLMNWFGRPFQPFELLHGDFLSTEYRKLITEEASIIFINNYAFQSDLETRIKRELLSDLKDGTRIVSTKPYVPLNKQGAITDRQLNDISVITEVAEMKPCLNPCSWTSAYVPYYLHTINRTKLENYFLKLRNSSLRAKSSDTGSRRSSTPNSSSKTSTNSRESSICCVRAPSRDKSSDNNSAVGGRLNNNGGGENEQDYTSFGPTTRRKWTEYVNEMEQQKRRQSSCSSSNGGGGEKKAAAKAILNIKNKQQQQLNSLSSSSSTTSISNNNIPKMLKIVKNFSNVGGTQMSENDNNNNLGGIPKLRLQQTTTIKKEEEEENIEKNIEENIEQNINKNIEQNINKNIEQNINKIETTTTTNMFVEQEEEKMVVENVCENTYVVEEETTKTPPTPKIINVETISEENKNMENKNVNEQQLISPRFEENKNMENKNVNEQQLISPRFEPISPDKISTPINNNNISNISIKQKTTGKRSYERKERINSFTPTTKGNRGRPRKSADSSNIHHHSSPKVPRFSEDARDGMELMHQMTCAIQMGKPMDAASILADLANQKANHTLKNAYENFFDEFHSKHSNKNIVVKEEEVKEQQQQPLSEQQQQNISTNNFTNFEQFRFNKLQTEKHCSQQQKQSRLLELQKRVADRRKWLLNAWSEFQKEMQLFNTDMDCLVNECQQQQKQEEEDSNTQQQQQNQNFQLQQQLALHLITQQQTQQHKLIEAAQAQLAIQVQQAQQANAVAVVANALNNNNNNSSPTNNNVNNVVGGIGQQQQQQQTSTTSNAVNQVSTVTSQLDLLINEMRERYSQQLTAQHLLSQITQFGLLNTIAPQEIAALQSIASGAALNNVVHQLTPFVQNFLATLDNLATTENNNINNIPSSSSIVINGDCSGIGAGGLGGGGGLNLSASLSNISGGDNNSANNSSNHSLNSSLNTSTNSQRQQRHSIGNSSSLQQISQNFVCQQTQNKKSAITVQQHISRESTVAEVVAEVAALPSTSPRKPFKPRPTRNLNNSGGSSNNSGGGNLNKRSNSHSNKHLQQQQVDDPKKQEEIERQIQ
uniref:Histone-lysine N-methyltransferase, H3 lysine-79 specific n=1 Tax=Meloidogyne floridensis TaxID=298350 RepID=A0A915NQZ5_9BILA